MAKESGYFLKLALNEDEKNQLTQLARELSDEMGIELSMSWLIRNLVRLTLHGSDNPKPAEQYILSRMHHSSTRNIESN